MYYFDELIAEISVSEGTDSGNTLASSGTHRTNP